MTHLYTTIERPCLAGDMLEHDVLINFHAATHTKGDPGRYYGEPGDCWPAEDAEWEFEIDSIALDPPHLPALTDAESQIVRAWFAAHHAEAVELAEEELAAREYDDDDRAYDRRKDDEMMGEKP